MPTGILPSTAGPRANSISSAPSKEATTFSFTAWANRWGFGLYPTGPSFLGWATPPGLTCPARRPESCPTRSGNSWSKKKTGFWATLFGIGDDETSKNGANEQINGQKALVVSGGGFFPKSIFGWIILTILIILLVAIFVYVQILHEQVKTLREERERGRNGNGNGNGLGVTHNNH